MKPMTPAMLLKALSMFRGFTKTAAEYLRDKERLRHLLAVAVSIAQGRGGKLFNDLQLLVRLLKASVSGAYTGFSVHKLVTIVAAILYLISPLDVIPDFIPFVDELLFGSLTLLFAAWKRDKQAASATTPPPLPHAPDR